MKIQIISIFLLLQGFFVYSQTWILQGGAVNDTEFTVITSEQFQRIVQANQTIARSVMFDYSDYQDFLNLNPSIKIIRGTMPNFNGYFYLSAKIIPKNDTGRYLAQSQTAWVFYGNTRTSSLMSITYLNNENFDNTISLRSSYNEYIRQYNFLLRLINGN
ncbi:MAG: hypothetical protein FWD13_07355 [Treponema sp.]|nr:hypothetical protein [Treponema sp.]